MRKLRVWRNAFLTIVVMGLAFIAWNNRFGPASSPYFHRNRFTGAECHRGAECWAPRWLKLSPGLGVRQSATVTPDRQAGP